MDGFDELWESDNPGSQSSTQSSGDDIGWETPSGDGWSSSSSNDGWGASDSGNNDGWGASDTNNDGWGSPSSSGGDDFWAGSDENEEFEPAGDQYSGMSGSNNNLPASDGFNAPESQEQFEELNNTPTLEPKQFNFSKKTIGLLLAGVCILIALAFALVDNIKITKNNNNQVQVQNNQNQGQQQQPQAQQGNTTVGNNVANGSVTFIEIPDDTSLNYSGDVLTASGTVVGKFKYLCGHQVIYCINIRIAVGSSAEEVSYYCNYSSFQAVGSGEIVTVTYQQVADGYISVNSISK